MMELQNQDAARTPIGPEQLGTPGAGVPVATRAWRRLVGVVLLVHAIAHLAGTSQAIAALDAGDGLEVLGGLVSLDTDAALAAWGAVWAIVAVVVAAAGVWALLDRPAARRIVAIATSISLAACLTGLWATAIGVAVNAGLLVATRLPIWRRR